MEKFSSFLKACAIGLGAFLLIGAIFLSDGDPVGTRLTFGLLGLSFVAATFSRFFRHLVLTLASIPLFIASISAALADSGAGMVIMLIFAAISLVIFLYSGHRLIQALRTSPLLLKLYNRSPKLRALFDPEVSSADSATQPDVPMSLEQDDGGNILIHTPADWNLFHAQYEPVREIYTKVVGVTFRDNESADRQTILSRCSNSDEISLEPYIYDGEPAYAVWTRHGRIGSLSKADAATISTLYADCVTLASIRKITGGGVGKYYGCNIVLTVYARKHTPDAALYPPQAHNAVSINEQFIAEAQWHAAHNDDK